AVAVEVAAAGNSGAEPVADTRAFDAEAVVAVEGVNIDVAATCRAAKHDTGRTLKRNPVVAEDIRANDNITERIAIYVAGSRSRLADVVVDSVAINAEARRTIHRGKIERRGEIACMAVDDVSLARPSAIEYAVDGTDDQIVDAVGIHVPG